jgi:hypothetical protein
VPAAGNEGVAVEDSPTSRCWYSGRGDRDRMTMGRRCRLIAEKDVDGIELLI